MEVFPTLHLEGDCKVYMEDVRVDRVVTTRARDLLKVYISCDNIIEKEYIYKVEKELHKQLFLPWKAEKKDLKSSFMKRFICLRSMMRRLFSGRIKTVCCWS